MNLRWLEDESHLYSKKLELVKYLCEKLAQAFVSAAEKKASDGDEVGSAL